MTANSTPEKTIREQIESVFMAGVGIAAADDIHGDDKDTAILNTQKYYVDEFLAQITRIIEECYLGSVTDKQSGELILNEQELRAVQWFQRELLERIG